MTLAEIESEIAATKLHLDKLKELVAARNQFNELLARMDGHCKTIEHLVQLVANHFNIASRDILSRKRDACFALPRQVVCYLARTVSSYTTTRIANELGLHHGSIIHAVRAVVARRDTDPAFASQLVDLIKACSNDKPDAL